MEEIRLNMALFFLSFIARRHSFYLASRQRVTSLSVVIGQDILTPQGFSHKKSRK